jgi:hypothetical protein
VLDARIVREDLQPVNPHPVGRGHLARGAVRVCSPNSAARGALEAFIRERFEHKHGAAVRSFLPVLLGLEDEAGRIVAAAGYRSADSGALYLEQYLGEGIESSIARRMGGTTSRAAIAEIGNFAAADCATAMTLVNVLAEFLVDRGHDWAVFTATRTVRGIMCRLGIELVELARAEQARVAARPDQWGSYYAHDPRVMLGHVPSWPGARDRAWSV